MQLSQEVHNQSLLHIDNAMYIEISMVSTMLKPDRAWAILWCPLLEEMMAASIQSTHDAPVKEMCVLDLGRHRFIQRWAF